MAGAMTTLQALYFDAIAAGRIGPDPAQEAVLDRLEVIRAALVAPRRGFFARRAEPVRGLYLWGEVGRGKSMLMDLFVASCDVPKRRVHFHAFMQEVQAALHTARKSQVDDALRPAGEGLARGIRVLALDEMQVTDIADAMILGRLFQILFDQGVTVVTTSNRAPDDLYKNGLNRALFLPFIALIKERLDVVELTGPRDYRLGRITRDAAWQVPHDGAKFDCAWAELTQGGAEVPLEVEVFGRKLRFDRHVDGILRVTFWEICGQALGPADYLALADRLRVLVIEDVPVLSAENFNAAKRFVTLIDALYEAKRGLMASAAASPEQLFVEGEGAFEFHRTASRLREMQSDGWGRDKSSPAGAPVR